jgi:hypothetical protein
MKGLEMVKPSSLKAEFKKFGDSFELVFKNRKTECTVIEEPHRRE